MPVRRLPHRPSWEHLRTEARRVQRLVRAGDPAATALVREFHPHPPEQLDDLRLAEAKLAVARSYGHAGWPRLKAYVEAITAYARDPHEVAPVAGDDAREFLRLACLVYGGDDTSRPARARHLLSADPSLAGRSLHTAAAAGDPAAAARLLARDSAQATTAGGPFGWEPLLYVTYSRVTPAAAGAPHTEVARLLLEHGADPNAGYLWDGTYLFTALTGAFGGGEDAPNQPPHPECRALATLLLEAGADPNDDQTIYNRHFRPDDDHLELLLAHGLGGPRRGPWPARLGGHLTDPPLLLEDALVFAADDDAFAHRVELLLRHGADPDGRGTRHPALRGMRPVERAHAGGAVVIERLLLDAGADPPRADPVDELLASCMRADRDAVHRALERDPTLAAAVVGRHPRALIDAAERGNVRGIELLVRLGYDIDHREGHAALHEAAYHGARTVCETILALGADPALRDHSFGGTPADWARHAHHEELAAWLDERAAERT